MSFGHESRSTDRYSHVQYLLETFCSYDEMGCKSWPFSICKYTTSDHKPIIFYLRYFNFEPSLKLQLCHA